jgi:ATP-dependent Lon protease
MGLDPEKIGKTNVHLHVPQGAIPKDGPSAGITMVSAMVSAFTGKKIRKALAMTGEITLRGQVLPVGGIKEKILAAKRAGIKEIIMCDRNKQDVEEIDDRYIKGLSFTYVSNILEVVQRAVTKEKAN